MPPQASNKLQQQKRLLLIIDNSLYNESLRPLDLLGSAEKSRAMLARQSFEGVNDV